MYASAAPGPAHSYIQNANIRTLKGNTKEPTTVFPRLSGSAAQRHSGAAGPELGGAAGPLAQQRSGAPLLRGAAGSELSGAAGPRAQRRSRAPSSAKAQAPSPPRDMRRSSSRECDTHASTGEIHFMPCATATRTTHHHSLFYRTRRPH